jgi:hypothetical protein
VSPLAVPSTSAADPPPPEGPIQPTHVDLGDPFYKSSAWTNDPKDLELDIYFHPLKTNIGSQFGIPNLRPVIKEVHEENYLLMDANKRFYTWNPNDGNLYRVKEDPLKLGDATIKMMNGFGTQDVEQMVNPAFVRK